MGIFSCITRMGRKCTHNYHYKKNAKGDLKDGKKKKKGDATMQAREEQVMSHGAMNQCSLQKLQKKKKLIPF